ncbi:MAG: hypothetical protein A4E73_00151 [Syntrophaceae bacterium PtaU1.Bin231]|nr:MAG: hypothetical protein A4E73_00151 [Syntrophaceae bacterium PtaU1.Bin231]
MVKMMSVAFSASRRYFFSDSNSLRSAFFRSVTSEITPRNPTGLPSASRIRDMELSAATLVPALLKSSHSDAFADSPVTKT